jgi:hypothetical protein
MCGWTVWVWVGSVLSFFVAAGVYGGMLNFAPFFYNVPQVQGEAVSPLSGTSFSRAL